ncbi:hypothetical protein WS91_28040 [Burkholderia sp. MSMB1498]|nr:hypothetical protein WS91_28040 [Burkholderia sp. MSMB1498]
MRVDIMSEISEAIEIRRPPAHAPRPSSGHAALPFQPQRAGRALDARTRRAIHAAFTANPCLRNWPAESIDGLCDAGYLKTWLNGELIFARHGPCDDIQVVLSGAIEMSWTNAAGARAVAVYMWPNEVINFIPVIDGGGSMHDQRAHGLTTLFHISRDALFAQFEREPALLRGVLELICVRSRALHRRIGRTALSGFRARLADQLLTLAEWHGQPTPRGIELTIRLSQEDLASLLVASRQSVNKELRRLVRERIIDSQYSRLTILDLGGLRAISDGEE